MEKGSSVLEFFSQYLWVEHVLFYFAWNDREMKT